MENQHQYCELSIVMPCLNEAATVGVCVEKAKKFIAENNIDGEVIVADNGSRDGSQTIAEKAGARVVNIVEKGYGSALIQGINNSYGKFIIMGDSDDSYDFLNLMPLLEKLRSGYELVMGNRFTAGIKPGSMPLHHRYFGNPVLSWIGRLFFGSKIGDFHCGLRGFTRHSFNIMGLRTTGMEFASEMIVKATLYRMKITEVPVILSPSGRTGRSHLRSFRDGWRHLQFLFLYSPRWLFFYPGLFLLLFGIIFGLIFIFDIKAQLRLHTLLLNISSIMIGFQSVIFAILTKTFAVHENLIPTNPIIEKILSKITVGKGLIIGALMTAAGLGGFLYTFITWTGGMLSEFSNPGSIRIIISSSVILILGIQLVLSTLFFSMLQLQTRK